MAKGESIVKLTLDSNQYERNVKNAKREWDQLTSAMGMSKAVFSKAAIAVGAVTTAIAVAKDAFMQMESNVDSLGETMRVTQDIYGSFLHALNNGDFSGFLTRIGDVITAARKAYEELDNLETKGTIRNPERARIQARMTDLKAIIRREGANSEAGKAASQELRKLEKDLTSSFKKEGRDNYNAFKSLVDERLESAGIRLNKNSYNFLLKSFSDEAAYERLRKGAKGGVSYDYNVGYQGVGKVSVTDTRNTNQKLLDLFTDEWRKENQSYLTASYQLKNSAAGVLLSDARYLRNGGGSVGGSGNTGGATWAPIAMGDFGGVSLGRSVSDVTKDLRRAQTEYNEAGDMFGRAAAAKMVEKFKEELDRMASEGNPFADAYSHDFQKDIDKLNEDSGEKKEKREVKMSDAIGDMASGISSMVGGLEQLGVDVPEGLKSVVGGIQGVMSILTGISTILSVIEAVSSADAIIPFARGGVVRAAGGYRVPGTMMSGDWVPALLNSGEVVFNMAQQGNLASQMRSNGGNVVDAQPYVDGEKVFLGVNAHTRRTGNGEIVTTRMLRNYGLIKG